MRQQAKSEAHSHAHSVCLSQDTPAPGADDSAALGPLDPYKREARRQWDNDPCGSHYVKEAQRHTLEWFLEAERYRYGNYAPWMPEIMEFNKHPGERVLEIGGGMGTDLAQFATHGAFVTYFDLSNHHMKLARENFRLRGLQACFIQGDAESLPFEVNSYDLVYSNGVLHHIPNTSGVIKEIHRVLKPGGKAIIMVYAQNSKHYWDNLLKEEGLRKGLIWNFSMGEIMSRVVEIGKHDARPLVKVYTRSILRAMFKDFERVCIVKRQITKAELTGLLKCLPLDVAGKIMGWNLVVKATKPVR